MICDVSIREPQAKCKYAETTSGSMDHAPTMSRATATVRHAVIVSMVLNNAATEHRRPAPLANGSIIQNVMQIRSAIMAAAHHAVPTSMFIRIHAKPITQLTAVHTITDVNRWHMPQPFVQTDRVISNATAIIQNKATAASRRLPFARRQMPRDVSTQEHRARCRNAQAMNGKIKKTVTMAIRATAVERSVAIVQTTIRNVTIEHRSYA